MEPIQPLGGRAGILCRTGLCLRQPIVNMDAAVGLEAAMEVLQGSLVPPEEVMDLFICKEKALHGCQCAVWSKAPPEGPLTPATHATWHMLADSHRVSSPWWEHGHCP